MELGWSSLDLLGGSRMGRENGEVSRSAPPRVLTLEEAKKRALAGVGGKLEVEEEEVQFQSFLHHHFHYLHQQQQQPPPPLTLTSTSTQKKRKTTATATAGAGRIVAVPGGHIVRSASSKDRHSKVCTAKGLRDRRVRLSAHTAIEFYDVQDRLGYDRPSMAVDWLLKNAKAAIDGLDELPPWQPTAATGGGVQGVLITDDEPVTNSMNSYSDAGIGIESFPMVPSSYPPDLLSRTSSHVQDLRLSLDTAETTARGSNSVGGGGYLFNFPAPQQQQQQQQQSMMIDPRFFSHQRGPLQSSISHPVPSWMDQIAPSHIMSMHPPPVPALFHRSSSSFPSAEFGASGGGGSGFSGFVVPTSWIQGREHMSGDVSDKPPASSHQ